MNPPKRPLTATATLRYALPFDRDGQWSETLLSQHARIYLRRAGLITAVLFLIAEQSGNVVWQLAWSVLLTPTLISWTGALHVLISRRIEAWHRRGPRP
jgi:hypothetical protein